jgi:hypothetical protein
MTNLDAFAPYRTVAWGSRPSGGLPAALRSLAPLYAGSNGGAYWDGALVIRRSVEVAGAPLDVLAWNAEGLWRRRYPNLDANFLFFAEDVFSIQYGIKERTIVELDPETGDLRDVAGSLEAWCSHIASDPDLRTGAPQLRSWQAHNRRLEAGERLLPKRPFILGGDYDWEHLVASPDVNVMLIGAAIADATRGIPDGKKVILRIEED